MLASFESHLDTRRAEQRRVKAGNEQVYCVAIRSDCFALPALECCSFARCSCLFSLRCLLLGCCLEVLAGHLRLISFSLAHLARKLSADSSNLSESSSFSVLLIVPSSHSLQACGRNSTRSISTTSTTTSTSTPTFSSPNYLPDLT